MPNTKILISTLLDAIRDTYVQELNDKGLSASKRTEKSLRTKSNENEGALYGAKHIYQLKHGRKPGKFPPVEAILDWMRYKHISSKDPKVSDRSVAFVIARKIAERGTDIYQGKRQGMEVDEKVKELTEEFKKKLNGEFKAQIKESMK